MEPEPHSDGISAREDEHEKPLRLLSLDGGGVRGLSILIILRYLMKQINPRSPPKPCDYFDLIGGTSTGGLIAILLGRLRLDIETCITLYTDIAHEVFQPKRSKANLFGRGKDFWSLEGAFDSSRFATKVQTALDANGFSPDALLMEEGDPRCKIFVCACRSETSEIVRLRSYNTNVAVEEVPSKIWEAARATSAASTFFKQVSIGNQNFTDGATGSNNPIRQVMDEALDLWPNGLSRIERIVSIGTGHPGVRAFGQNLKELGETLVRISTQAETTAEEFQKSAARELGLGTKYFRFNVLHGLGGIGLEDYKAQGAIEAATNSYLNKFEVRSKCSRFAETSSPPMTRTQRHNLMSSLVDIDVDLELSQIAVPGDKIFDRLWVCQEVHEWNDGASDARVLLVLGKPGSGKSVFLAHIRRLLGTKTAYFACRENRDNRRSPTLILASLLHQIFAIQPVLCQHAVTFKEKTEWTYERLMSLFRDVLSSTDARPMTLIVDALDECHQDSKTRFINDISTIFRAHSDTHFKLVMSSRHYPYLDCLQANRLDLDICPAMLANMIDFVTERVDKLVQVRPEFELERNDLIGDLATRANGMYRLVVVLIDELESTTDSSRGSIRKFINSVPESIAQLYDQIWERNAMRQAKRARRIFPWILCSFEPLSHQAMAVAVAVQSCTSEHDIILSNLDVSRSISKDLAYLFGPLVRVEPSFELSHQSIADHFLGRELDDDITGVSSYVFDEAEIHAEIALCCLRYLNSEDFRYGDPNEEVLGSNEFLTYALKHVAHHVSLGQMSTPYQASQIATFVNAGIWAGRWMELPYSGFMSYLHKLSLPAVESALQFCCRYNSPLLLRYFFEEGHGGAIIRSHTNLVPPFSVGRLIFEALIGKSEECLVILFAKLHPRRLQEVSYNKLLEVACMVVPQNMSDAIASQEDRKSQFSRENAFSEEVMAMQPWYQVFKAISIHYYMYCYVTSLGEPKTPFLHIEQSSSIERLRLVYRTLSESMTERYRLHQPMEQELILFCIIFCLYASWTGGSAEGDILSRHSPCVMDMIKLGNLPIAKFLIKEGANVGVIDSDGTSTLHWAAQTGDAHLVNMLLARKSLDVNVQNDEGLTPLHYACSRHFLWEDLEELQAVPKSVSRGGVVKSLLKAGADPKLRDIKGNTPFQTLSRVFVPEWKSVAKSSDLNWRETGLNEAIDLLLNDVEDLVEWDSKGGTPLHYACFLWPVSAIQKLLEFLGLFYLGAELLDHWGRTPLHYAAIRGFEKPDEVVSLLIDAGVDIYTRDVLGQSAMHAARECHNTATMSELANREKSIRQRQIGEFKYQTWLETINQKYSDVELPQSIQSMTKGLTSPALLQTLQSIPFSGVSTGPYEKYPSMRLTHHIKRLQKFISHSGILDTSYMSTVLHDASTPLKFSIAIPFESAHVTLSIDPFAGVMSTPIHRPLPLNELRGSLELAPESGTDGNHNSIVTASKLWESPPPQQTISDVYDLDGSLYADPNPEMPVPGHVEELDEEDLAIQADQPPGKWFFRVFQLVMWSFFVTSWATPWIIRAGFPLGASWYDAAENGFWLFIDPRRWSPHKVEKSFIL